MTNTKLCNTYALYLSGCRYLYAAKLTVCVCGINENKVQSTNFFKHVISLFNSFSIVVTSTLFLSFSLLSSSTHLHSSSLHTQNTRCTYIYKCIYLSSQRHFLVPCFPILQPNFTSNFVPSLELCQIHFKLLLHHQSCKFQFLPIFRSLIPISSPLQIL